MYRPHSQEHPSPLLEDLEAEENVKCDSINDTVTLSKLTVTKCTLPGHTDFNGKK